MTLTRNRLFDDIAVGDRDMFRHVVTEADLYVFATATGNLNPVHLPDLDGDGDPTTPAVAPAMWLAALPSVLLGTRLPGPGTLYRAQSITFHERACVGDVLDISIRVMDKRPPRLIVCEVRVARDDGTVLADGIAEVFAPDRALEFEDLAAPRIVLGRHEKIDRLLDACMRLPPLRTAVVSPHDAASLQGAVTAARSALIEPVLIGDPARIKAVAATIPNMGDYVVEPAATDEEAAARAVALARDGQVGAIMKGCLHSDTLLWPVVHDGGLRGERRLSHVFVMDVPGHETLLLVTDAAINIAPDLPAKVDIVQNAIDLARALGIETPKVGILSAIETVNPKIPSSMDAAVLSKMAERGQITGGIVDGPLAMDNAVDLDAARTKGIRSLVAGRADVLVAPNLEAGNILAKELTFLSGAEAAGIVMGATVPIMLTSRADSTRSRLASAAVAVLLTAFRSTGRTAVGMGPVEAPRCC